MSGIMEWYKHAFYEQDDPRTRGWWLLQDPLVPILIAAMYLYVVCVCLPKFMQDRKPFALKTLIQVYNVIQIIICSVLVYMFITSGWLTKYSLGCQPVDYSQDPLALRGLNAFYWVCVLKIIDFLETIIFILRKKYNQVTVLHVYHHVSTFLASWLSIKFVGGGMCTLAPMLNCFIHVLMYVYYFLAASGPKMQEKLSSVKSKLTLLQIIQFGIMIVHMSTALREECPVPNLWVYLLMPDILILFVMFTNFYIRNYILKPKQK